MRVAVDNSEYDICECGDFRRDHVNGSGECKLNTLGHGGPPPCKKFHFASPADPNEIEQQERLKSDVSQLTNGAPIVTEQQKPSTQYGDHRLDALMKALDAYLDSRSEENRRSLAVAFTSFAQAPDAKWIPPLFKY